MDRNTSVRAAGVCRVGAGTRAGMQLRAPRRGRRLQGKAPQVVEIRANQETGRFGAFFFSGFFFLYLFLFVFVVFCFVLFCRRSRAGRASRVCHARVARTPRARLRSPAPSTMHRWGGRAGRGLGPFSGRGASPRPGWGPLGQEGRGRGRGHAPPSAARREVGRGQARRGSPRPGSQALGHLVPLAGLPSPARRGGGAGGAGVPHLVF